ncbi:MAG: tetratricopeptide repeat protein [Calditrichaeota bacterium]|nr:tetratricopeptide repeat protein [Calditrichota bacterium]MBT7619077.1 tetratricopeptide repeat protein [Calditrichota bacterium]MBT7788263.1 tetratricopeptide repeat protein [Calditrichota bacterium]
MSFKINDGIKTVLITAILALAIYGFNGCAPIPQDIEDQIVEEKNTEIDPLAAIKSTSNELGMHRSFAYQYYQQNDFATARIHYDTVRTYDYKHEFPIYQRLAVCYNKTGEPDSAIWAYEQGIKYFPEDAYLHTSLAHMYRNRGRVEDAIVHQLEAIKIKPDQFEYYVALKDMYKKIDEYDKAIETLEKLVELMPDDPEINDELANLIRAQRGGAEYLQALRDGVEKFPDDHSRRLALAQALLAEFDNDGAVEVFKKYTTVMPGDPQGWMGLAKTLDNLERTSEAIKAYKKLVDLNPKDIASMVAIGTDYLTQNNWSKSLDWARRALNVDSKYGSAIILMGDVYQKVADVTSGDNPKYSDKLVFIIAYGLYERASKLSDPQSRNDGKRAMNSLKATILETEKMVEDWFQYEYNKEGTVRPYKSGYKWINKDWSETKYIKTYLAEVRKTAGK